MEQILGVVVGLLAMMCQRLAVVVVCGSLVTGCSTVVHSPSGSLAPTTGLSAEAVPPLARPESSPPAAPPQERPIPSADAATFWFSGTSTTTGPNAGYFFLSPSGKWRCAIVERLYDGPGAGCESTTGRNMPVRGAPLVPANDIPDNLVPPSSIVMISGEEPRFIRLGQPYLDRPQEPTPTLDYGQNLTGLGYTCNTQETGISCRNDGSGRGFTFSSKGFAFEYTPVAAAGPIPLKPAPAEINPDLVLGMPSDQYSSGYGSSRPTGISTNGLCGNTINDVSWESWGEPVVRGSGTWCQNSGSRSRGEALSPVQLTASDVGDCKGRTAYRKLQFDSQPPTSICSN